MCGLAGFIWTDSQRPAAEETVRRMARAIAHRGPDDEGFFSAGPVALGHRRLSIIDLSDAGHQPMLSRDGRYVIVYNGEIYNYLELRDELRAGGSGGGSGGIEFSSDSDTEVILAAWERWGPQCVNRFNGMWAFALLDQRERKLFLSRDRFGIKPLYYVLRPECFAFASEIKAILAALPEEREANLPLIHYFMPGGALCDGAETFFRNVVSLPQAHNAIYDLRNGALKLERYWQVEPERFAATWCGGDPVETLRGLLGSAIELHMRSDVPVGTCLSGGVDSSTIVALMSGMRKDPVHTFSGLYPDRDCDEQEYVDAVNEHCHTVPCSVRPNPGEAREPGSDLLDELAAITWHQDMPSAGPGLYTQYHVMRRAREDVKVILDGQGADELFAGYLPYFVSHVEDLLAQGLLGRAKAAGVVLSMVRHWGWPQAAGNAQRVLGPKLAGVLRRLVRSKPRPAAGPQPDLFANELAQAVRGREIKREWSPSSRGNLNRALELHVTSQCLPALLHYEDRNSMAFSIEARVPLLDYRIVEFALGLESSYKINGSWTKWVLRKAAAPMLPAKVAWRRSKLGYPTPFARWIRQPSIRDGIEQLLLGREFRARQIMSDEAVRFFWQQHQSRAADFSWMLWRCVTLELWHRQFIDAGGTPAASTAGGGRRTVPVA